MPPQSRRAADAVAPFNPLARRRTPALHRLRIAEVCPLTEDSVSITFAVPEHLGEEYRFRPGQHLVLLHPDGRTRRTYSICAPAGGRLRVGVKRQPGGVFSTWATTELQAGDELDVMTPMGRFCLDLLPPHTKHYGAIAVGSGITPILSHIATALEVERHSRVTLVYANRTRASTMFSAEIEDLRARHPDRFAVHHVLSRESLPGNHLVGRLGGDLLRELVSSTLPAAGVDEWLLCGPEDLVGEVSAVLRALSVPDRSIHRELFTSSGDDLPLEGAGTVVDSEVTVIVRGEKTTLRMSAEEPSVLDAVLPLRREVPYSCRDGVCATCRALTVEGSVVMRRATGLDADERGAGYVLTCQARPTSGRVVLDFDA
ncbi:MAG: Ring,2-phenylacetyl-CoA epoxidase subunit PaaE [Modestobacter sp.]|jgi:ring-1,2-phenylacetyl-CoA epoxidase subunit PaaE|nr:Ring,2-phenylacetyl-CoA epoxidase subunit PaaE [Modestobacter sp.]